MRHYCTYFDHNYLSRGLALYHSLREHAPESRLWVLCLSGKCHEILTQLHLPNLHPFAIEEFEAYHKDLAAVKQTRSTVEYYFTCTPSLVLFVADRVQAGELITYLDSDMFFFDDPKSVFDEIGESSIAIVPHRFPERLKRLEDRGRFNVGWVSFRKDPPGMACLNWWREKCMEWCHDVVEPTRFADQKYLDRWPDLFKGVAVLRHKGVNAAPYNLSNYTVDVRNGKTWIDDDPLVAYHFHGFRQLNSILYDTNLAAYGTRSSKVIRRGIYGRYIRALRAAQKQIEPFFPAGLLYSRFARRNIRNRPPALGPLRRALDEYRILKRNLRQILNGEQVFCIGGHVL